MSKLLITAIVLLLLPQCFGVHADTIPLYVLQANILEEAFNDFYEVIVIVTTGGNVFFYTNQLEDVVILPISVIEEHLKAVGEDVSDIVLVAHNHWGCPFFSAPDISYYHKLCARGFQGAFVLYESSVNQITSLLWGFAGGKSKEVALPSSIN